MSIRFGIIGLFFTFSACRKDINLSSSSIFLQQVPPGFPPVSYPQDNGLNINRIALGKLLFFDPILSADSSVSCSSCHKPEFLFADTGSLSFGIQHQTTKRNTPSIINIAYHPYFNLDGGVRTLELQALVPLQATNEMNSTIEDLEQKLMRQKQYRSWFQKAFGTEPNIYGVTRALAAYQRTLIMANSKFDQYFYEGYSNALSMTEAAGMSLFFSEKSKCSHCHNGFNFTNYAFENNGLYLNYADQGRYLVTLNLIDQGKFKVPSLRHISHTSPYMHDGSLKTLDDVLNHYASGGQGHPNQSEIIANIQLNEVEKAQIVAFLKTL